MKKTIQHIAVAVWLLTLTVSTMGFNLHTLYCYCTGESELSLFEIHHQCPKKHTEEANFLAKLPPCCQKAMACHKTETAQNTTEEDHDCTQKNNQFVKADLKFLATEKTKLTEFPFVAVVKTQSNYHPNSSKYFIPHTSYLIPVTYPPPQYFGRQLLNFIQVYRC